MEIAAIDVGTRFLCAQCKAQDFDRESFEVDAKQLGELSAIEFLARKKRVGSSETVAINGDRTAAETAIDLARESQVTIEIEDSVHSSSHSMSDSSKIGLGILAEDAQIGIYRIRSTLGQGGMGIVYGAYDPNLDRTVALKVLNRELCKSPRFIERFQREAKAAAGLSHRNITHVYSIGEEKGNHFFVMEYVDGQNLSEIVKEVGELPHLKAVDIIRQTAVGLRVAAQSKIIHRDVKPSNLLLTSEGEVKITDFGLAKAVQGSAIELTTTGVVMGTPVYMSPEQSKGKPVDHRSDIYSLGCTFFHLVCARPPFEADSAIATILKHINDPVKFPEDSEVPRPVRAVILRMLAKTPEERYQDYDELIADIDRIITGEEVAAQGRRRETRVVVVNYQRPESGKKSLFRVGKISLARTNLKLGRRGKAVALLEETVTSGDEPTLRAEAGLLLLDLYDKERDVRSARRMAEIIARCSVDGASTYAIWKLARFADEEALRNERSALNHYERLLLHASPEHHPILDAQITRLKNRIAASEEALSSFQVILVEE